MAQLVQMLDLTAILDEPVDWRYKGWPPSPKPVTVRTIGDQRWNALAADLLFPLVVVKEEALAHNIALMARYARAQGLSLAPHAKTPLAPQIVQRQLDAGAWGVTVANVPQARLFRAFGAPRIFIANEVVEPRAAQWLAAELERDRTFECYALVDCEAGAAALGRGLGSLRSRRLPVLVEVGTAGGRAGCRTEAEARAVARAVSQVPALALAGVEGYEGAVPVPAGADRVAAVDRFLREVRAIAAALIAEGAFDGRDEVIVSAGGSLFLDRVAALLAPPWPGSVPVRVVARSGAYITHDVDQYEQWSPLGSVRGGGGPERMRPALELLAVILSRPEQGLAIAGFGKRDAPYDVRLPLPAWVWREGRRTPIEGAVVRALNDQHAYLDLAPHADLRVGEIAGFDVSHPCTTFDKWRLLPLVDEAYTVLGGIRTFF